MPVTEGKQYALFSTPGLKRRPDSIEADGRQRILNEIVEFVGDEPAGHEVKLLSIPRGALVDLTESTVIADADASCVIDLGCDDETDNLIDGLALDGAGTKAFDATAVELVENKTDKPLKLTVSGGAPPAAGAVRVRVAYYIR